MKTFIQTKEAGAKARGWRIIDAADLPVGRIASAAATLLKGKHRPEYTPHVDGGDFVVVINASKAVFTGNKPTTKVYRHHTGYFGGLKEISAEKLLATKPTRVIQLAVAGMLPKGALGRSLVKKLKVYADEKHPHGAQAPVAHKISYKTRTRKTK